MKKQKKVKENIYPLKWFGSKRRLVKVLVDHLPKNFNNYYEPFFGSGALFWHLARTGRLNGKKLFIGDINPYLMSCLFGIKENPSMVYSLLQMHKQRHSKQYFDKIQKQYFEGRDFINVQIAASFLYINATSFSGIYRERNDTLPNLMMRKTEKPVYVELETLMHCSLILQRCELQIANYDHLLFTQEKTKVKKGDFVYLDPPYFSFSHGDKRTVYNTGGFSDDQQRDLKEHCDRLTEMGVFFLQSNSCDQNILKLYDNYQINQIPITYKVTHQQKRGNRTFEVLISNYELAKELIEDIA